jgi:hypothetical protein
MLPASRVMRPAAVGRVRRDVGWRNQPVSTSSEMPDASRESGNTAGGPLDASGEAPDGETGPVSASSEPPEASGGPGDVSNGLMAVSGGPPRWRNRPVSAVRRAAGRIWRIG